MLRRSLLAIAALLPTAALAHPPQAPQGAEAQRMIDEVTAFRARLAKAIETKDFNTLRSSYADSYSHTHDSGKLDTKDARVAAAMAGEKLIEAAPASELVFRVFTGPTVIVTGKTYDFRWVSVYVTAIGGWQLAVSQATRLA